MTFNKEIIGCLIVFIVVYVILYIDKCVNNTKCETYKCKCKVCEYKNEKFPSIKVPILFAIIALIGFKFTEPYINNYFNSCIALPKQDIITEMVDF